MVESSEKEGFLVAENLKKGVFNNSHLKQDVHLPRPRKKKLKSSEQVRVFSWKFVYDSKIVAERFWQTNFKSWSANFHCFQDHLIFTKFYLRNSVLSIFLTFWQSMYLKLALGIPFDALWLCLKTAFGL